MRNVKKRSLAVILLILIMSGSLLGITVSGLTSFHDSGNDPGGWKWLSNRIHSSGYLSDGPHSGNGGSGNFYYFGDSGGDIEIGSAKICKVFYFSEEEKKLLRAGQLKIGFDLAYYGWSSDEDYFDISVQTGNFTPFLNSYIGIISQSFEKNDIRGEREWRNLQVCDGALVRSDIPSSNAGVRVTIYAGRRDGSDLDVYLDDIKLRLYDDTTASIIDNENMGKIVDQIIDKNNAVITPVKGSVNWVNPGDTIKGTLAFNEYVKACTEPNNLNVNVQGASGRIRGYMVSSGSSMNGLTQKQYSLNDSQTFEYRIPLTGATHMEDSTIKLIDVGERIIGIKTVGYNTLPVRVPCGPFDYPVLDLGGNYGIAKIGANFDAYNLKLDSAAPVILTSQDQYGTFAPGRTSVNITVREEDKGREQSPLTLSYYWKYLNSSNTEVVEAKKDVLISSTITPVKDTAAGTTTYTVPINIPAATGIPQYQDFWLFVKAEDAARNSTGEFREFLVRQKDMTPPDLAWEKSVYEDGTAVSLAGTAEDTGYAKGRTVTFSAADSESGVESVKYLWSASQLQNISDSNMTVVQPVNGKYNVSGSGAAFSKEGAYYLYVKAYNKTETGSGISEKRFNFDNEAPRVSRIGAAPGMNSAELKYQAADRALNNKFLYTVVAKNSNGAYDSVTPPVIGGEIQDSGIWLAKAYDNTGGAVSINYTDFAGYITGSGDYKLVARFYDDKNNCSQIEETFVYDLTAPQVDSFTGDTATYKKSHQVTIKVSDNLSPVKEVAYQWVPEGSLPDIANYTAASAGADGYIINGSGNDGRYSIHLKLTDDKNNVKEEILSINSSTAYFHFDNSPPTVKLTCNTENPVKTVRFAYSELEDTYTDVVSFKYGISTVPDSEPAEWVGIVPVEGGAEIVHSIAFETDGPRYLSVRTEDAVGNVQVIGWPEPFLVDVTKPTGKAYYNATYTNMTDAWLNLEIDELKSSGSTIFKTILSSQRELLEDAAISGVQPEAWKDISYDSGAAVYQWKLSDTTDGEQKVYVRFMDEAGNPSDIYEAGIILDRTAPTGEINYDITAPTKQNVTAALTVTDILSGSGSLSGSEITILNNSGVNAYTFNRNGEFEFIFVDEAGNKGRAAAAVGNIDRNPPTAAITYSHPRDVWTNESITATLNLTDPNGAAVTSAGGATHTFDANGTFTFSFEDTLGNQGSMTAEVKNIDKVAPEGHIVYTYSDTAPVTVYLAVYEPVKVTNNGGSFRYMFDTNGEFTFNFEDKAGNGGQAKAVVNTITSSQKYVDVVYSESGLTSGSVDIDFVPFSGLSTITSPTVTEDVYYPAQYTYRFTENGDKPAAIKILSGAEENSVRTVVGSVYNIDTTLPDAEVYLSTESLTNQSVTATLLTYDDKGKTVTILNNNGESEYEFTQNGSFTFDFKDEAGSIGHKTITVSNIDKTAPAAQVTYTKDNAKNTETARISFTGETEAVEILNNNGNDTFQFVENGAFTFRFADQAGNTGEFTALVEDLSEGISAGEIKYYIDGIEIADPTAGTTNKSITAELSFAEGGAYSIKNNGGSSSYVFDRNGEFTFIFEDNKGNRGFATAKAGMIDKEAPKLDILASTVKATNQDVVITINYSDNKGVADVQHNLEAETITAVEGKITYQCKTNKQIWVKVTDAAGNETYKTFNVNNIDREVPEGSIQYIYNGKTIKETDPKPKTNQDVKAVLNLNEPATVQNNNGKLEYSFTTNGSFTFEFIDTAGNQATKTAVVDWIDKTPPVVTLEYSKTALTNQPVEVTVKADEEIIVINNGGAAKRVFYENGTYTFDIKDTAGNQALEKDATATVNWIDTVKPEILIKGLKYTAVMQNGAYTEAGFSAADSMDGDLTNKVVIEGSVNTAVPGKYQLKYKVMDSAGNENEAVRMVSVVATDEILLILNGIPAEGEWMTVNSRSVKASCFGNEGSYSIKWAEGKKTQAFFKSEGTELVPETTVQLTNNSWFTFFIQDRERKTQSIQVYINE